MILLVNPPVSPFAPFQNKCHYGLASLKKFLEDKFFKIDIIDTDDVEEGVSRILEYKDEVKLVGFSGMSYQMNSAQAIAKKIKKELPDIPIVFGGPAATGYFERLLREDYIDFVIIGEGEIALSSLIRVVENNGDLATVPSLAYMEDNIIKQNNLSRILPFDEIPTPTRSDMPDNGIFYDHALEADSALIIFSRGCHGRCSFCMAHKVFPGKVRFVEIERAVKYIKDIISDYGIRNFVIDDDNFLADKQFADNFAAMVKGLNIRFRINMSGTSFDKELLLRLKDAGLVKISVGVESIVPEIEKLICKGVNRKSLIELVNFGKENNILIALLFMAGLPGENRQAFIENLRFIAEARPNGGIDFQMFQPHPGTFGNINLYEYGRVLIEDLDFYFSDNIVFLPDGYKDTQELIDLVEKFLKKAVTASNVQQISMLQLNITKKNSIVIDPGDFNGRFNRLLTHWRGSVRCKSGLSIIKGQDHGSLEYHFNISEIKSEKYMLAFRGGSHPEGFPQGDEFSSDVRIYINDKLLWKGRFRSIHTIGHLFKFKFPSRFLKQGKNSIRFEVPEDAELKNGLSIFAFALTLYFRKYETGILLIPV